MTANLSSPLLVEALARVERENFLGPPPWHFSSQAPSKDGSYRTTVDVRDLYHDVMVALKSDRQLNNGQPSVIAGCIAQLDLAPGKRVLHVGCGTGYYTAIMSRIVGPEGAVIACEIDPDLAQRATANLSPYPNVLVHPRDGAALPLASATGDPTGNTDSSGSFDAILINAAVTHPHPSWFESLRENGRLILPLSVGATAGSPKALAIRITRHNDRFNADPHSIFTLYPSATFRDPERQSLLHASLESKAIGLLRSIRIEPHTQALTCLVHTSGFCLSASSMEDPA